MAQKSETVRPLQQRVFPPETLDRLREAGLEVTPVSHNPERIRVMRGHCALLFERRPDQHLVLCQPPGYLIRGDLARLWDAGYQKFWLLGPVTEDPFPELRVPALSGQLRELHLFEEVIRLTLGIQSFYNEAIGSTNKITAYDRLYGRDSSSTQKRQPF